MVSLDSENASWLRENMEGGKLPNLAALARGGVMREVNAAVLAGVAYPSMYTGLRPADHGWHFPIQWNPREQCVRSQHHLPAPGTILERMDKGGKRLVAIDPPECPPFPLQNGFCASGVQFRARILLSQWSTNAAGAKRLMARVGPAPRADEIFGAPSVPDLRLLRRSLLHAPERLTAAALHFLEQDPPDCLWVTCCGMHVAGHQFFDLPSVHDPAERRVLEATRLEIAQGYDRLIGALVSALPPNSRVLVTYPKGMDRVTQWLGLLPFMLRRILGEHEVTQPVTPLRQFIPRRVRRWIASAVGDRYAVETMARLSTPRADWKRTRAFCVPSDYPGFIRYNAAGRERDGIVADRDLTALTEEIADGLRSFTTMAGEPCVESVDTAVQLLGSGRAIDSFPDLIVRWKQLESRAAGGAIRSPKFGEIRREAEAVGRSGNHTPGAFAILHGAGAAGSGSVMEVEDIPVTLMAGVGLTAPDLPGRSHWAA